MIKESCVNQMFFVVWPLSFFWETMIDNSWWPFWDHFYRVCLIHPLLSQSKKLSIDLIIDLNKSGKSLGAILKQLQIQRSTVQTTISKCKVHGMAVSLPDPEENTNYHLLLGENWSGWSWVNQKPTKSKSAMNCISCRIAGSNASGL